jgi:Uma2 family endonuclease
MTGAKKYTFVSVDDYLRDEDGADVKHEYVDGSVYAMGGARNAHNIISLNISAALWSRLRGLPCQPFNSDTKIRLRLQNGIRFYYPDASVVCAKNNQDDVFQDEPVVVFEVLSKRTRRIDEGEKKEAYCQLPSLKVYALVEQDSSDVRVFRRSGNSWSEQLYSGLDDVLPLPEIDVELPLSEIFSQIQFVAE